MAKKIKIKFFVYSDSETSMGLQLLFATLNELFELVVEKFNPTRPNFEGVDFIFVSLIWWEDVLCFMRDAKTLGIKPGAGPKIIIGGSAFNPHLLAGFYDVGVLGDGEVVICDLIDRLLSGVVIDDIPGVVTCANLGSSKTYRTAQTLSAFLHKEIRTSAIPRIEIARGCKWKCPFCQVAGMKPYRELPVEIIKTLCLQVKGKSVGLFAPDRVDHSGFAVIQEFLIKQGKRDSSRDARFDSLMKFVEVDGGLTLGLEGLTEKGRHYNRKAGPHAEVVGYFNHIFNTLRTKKGEHVGNVQMYMILDLPTEREGDPFAEFETLLKDIDSLCTYHFTLFVVGNSFSAKPFTKFSHEGITLFSEAREKFNKLYVPGNNMKIAKRGGLLPPTKRIVQACVDRGDERLSHFVSQMATVGRKYLSSWDRGVVRAVCKEIDKTGWDNRDVWGKTEKELWFDSYKIEKLSKC